MPAEVLVLMTGGTFDKSYNPVEEVLEFKEGTIVEKVLEKARIQDIQSHTVMMIDSLMMDDDKRATIAEAIEASAAKRVVIVHGTSTMGDTAEYLRERFVHDRTIVLTGALVPLRYDAVEASVNFGMAFCAARYMPAGVYIAMHGLVAAPNAIAKNAFSGQFLPI